MADRSGLKTLKLKRSRKARREGEALMAAGRRKQNTPHPVDVHVGSRVRERRMTLGMSQPKLAAALGIAYQQLYKYEQAKNRIGASRLYELSKVLGVPVTFFFEGIEGTDARAQKPKRATPSQQR